MKSLKLNLFKKIGGLAILIFFGALCTSCGCRTLTDTRDGQVYDLVSVGDTCMFAENLNYDEHGDCYDNDPENCEIYGKLYGAGSHLENVCPDGWRVPTPDELQELISFLGGEEVAGTKLKSDIEWNGTNTSGLSALPGGQKNFIGISQGMGRFGEWIFYNPEDETTYILRLSDRSDAASIEELDSTTYASIRCVRESE